MFKVIDNPTFTHTVKVSVPADGGHETQSFKCTFRVLPTNVFHALDFENPDHVDGFLVDVIERFDELIDEAGEPVAYNDAIRDKLTRLPYVRQALCQAYVDAAAGARLGN